MIIHFDSSRQVDNSLPFPNLQKPTHNFSLSIILSVQNSTMSYGRFGCIRFVLILIRRSLWEPDLLRLGINTDPPQRIHLLKALDYDSTGSSTTVADSSDPDLALCLSQNTEQCGDDPGTTGAERMAKSNSSTVYVDLVLGHA